MALAPMAAMELARDSEKWTLGDLTQWAGQPVLEFTLRGRKGSWMYRNIPDGIHVHIYGWMVLVGIVGAVLAALAAMSVAKTAKDFIKARQTLDQASGGTAFRPGTMVEGVNEKLAELTKERQEEIQREYAADLAAWTKSFYAWYQAYIEENDKEPTKDEAQSWIDANPKPSMEDYL